MLGLCHWPSWELLHVKHGVEVMLLNCRPRASASTDGGSVSSKVQWLLELWRGGTQGGWLSFALHHPAVLGIRSCLKVVTVFLVTRGDCLVPNLPHCYTDRMTSFCPILLSTCSVCLIDPLFWYLWQIDLRVTLTYPPGVISSS